MARLSRLSGGLAALGLIVAAAAGAAGAAASAAEPPHTRPHAAKPAAQANLAPVRQRAVSTAVGIGGDALATASNQNLALQNSGSSSNGRGSSPPLRQINRSPSVQTAVSAAVSVGGNSAALAANNADGLQNSTGAASGLGGSRPGVPLSPQQLGRAPSTSTAVSTAISIGGVPIATQR
jgi:hypothetical protein